MLDFLLQRSTVIGFAVFGGVLSLLASWCAANQKLSPTQINWIHKASYGAMGISIILFLYVGLTAGN